jgi:hypothetical protein
MTVFQDGNIHQKDAVSGASSTPSSAPACTIDENDGHEDADTDTNEESDPEIIYDDNLVSDRLLVDGQVDVCNAELLDILSDMPHGHDARMNAVIAPPVRELLVAAPPHVTNDHRL